MTDALFDSPAKTLLLDREPPDPPRPPVSAQTSQPRANASPSYSVRSMSCT